MHLVDRAETLLNKSERKGRKGKQVQTSFMLRITSFLTYTTIYSQTIYLIKTIYITHERRNHTLSHISRKTFTSLCSHMKVPALLRQLLQ